MNCIECLEPAPYGCALCDKCWAQVIQDMRKAKIWVPPMSADEIVTTCAGCGSNRYCREYKGLYLCLSGVAHCWRRREAIHAHHQNKPKEDK